MAENDINTDNIRDYLARQGGKARNSDVVLHFKEYLNYPDPKKKEYYRQKFKEYINVVAVKKDENGVKYIVLKKKYREPVDSESSPRQWRIGHPHEYEQGTLEKSPSRSEAERRSAEERWRQQISRQEEEEKRHADELRQAARRERERRFEEEKKAQEKKKQEEEEERIRNERIQEGLRQQEIERMQKEKELFDKKSQEEFQKNVIVIVEPSGEDTDEPDGYTGPSEQTDVLRFKEGERIIEEKAQISSVTDQIQLINKSFETEKSPKSRRKGNAGLQKSISETSRGSDLTLNKDTLSSSDSQASLKSTFISGQERLWILYSAQNDLANLSLLLSENKDLAYSKDFINTAMHWGAKHGRKEMIKLVANSGVDINTRSHAGYTPLHIAAIHNREAIMKYLTSEYEADVNIRDYSGKRPHQYLANTEPTYLQQTLKVPSSGVLPNIHMGHLEKFEGQGKRSKFNTLRASFRALRTWGSTESIPKKRSVSTGVLVSSPMMRPKSMHVEHHMSFTPDTSPKIQHRPLSTLEFDQFRMPHPVPTHVKRAKRSVFGAGEIHKSGSDSNILESSTFI